MIPMLIPMVILGVEAYRYRTGTGISISLVFFGRFLDCKLTRGSSCPFVGFIRVEFVSRDVALLPLESSVNVRGMFHDMPCLFMSPDLEGHRAPHMTQHFTDENQSHAAFEKSMHKESNVSWQIFRGQQNQTDTLHRSFSTHLVARCLGTVS